MKQSTVIRVYVISMFAALLSPIIVACIFLLMIDGLSKLMIVGAFAVSTIMLGIFSPVLIKFWGVGTEAKIEEMQQS